MPSSNKTELETNLWSYGDAPKMEDFNNDNRIVSDAIIQLQKENADLKDQIKNLSQSGTWTPELVDEEGNSEVIYNYQRGNWRKIGDLVHIEVMLSISDIGSLDGTLKIVLPGLLYKNTINQTYPQSVARIAYTNVPEGTYCSLVEFETPSTLRPYFSYRNSSGQGRTVSLSADDIRNSSGVSSIYFTLYYIGVK